MPGDNSRNTSAWLMPETGGFATIPDATGAAALFIPTNGPAIAKGNRAIRQRQYATGRAKRAPHHLGKGMGEIALNVDLSGFAQSTSANGQPPPTEDWLDWILTSLMGAPVENNAALASSATANTIGTSAALTEGQLIAVRGPNTLSGRTQWARVSGGASPYGIAPNWAVVPTAAQDTVYACRTWFPKVTPGSLAQAGETLTLINDQDGRHYALPGARPNSLVLNLTAGEDSTADVGFIADERIRQQFASLPNAPLDDAEPAFGVLSAVSVDGVLYDDVESVKIDLRPRVTEVRAVGGFANGRSDWRVVELQPVVTLKPLNAAAWEDHFNAGDIVSVGVQFGPGSLANARLNTLFYWAEGMQVTQEPNAEDADGIFRQTVQLEPADTGATGVDAFYFLIGRV